MTITRRKSRSTAAAAASTRARVKSVPVVFERKHQRVTVGVSQSASRSRRNGKRWSSLSKNDGLRSFLKCMYVLVMDVNNHPVTKFTTPFRQWYTESQGFLSKLGILKEVTKLVNAFMVTRKFTHDDAVDLGKLMARQKPTIVADATGVDPDELQLFNACTSNLARDSAGSWKTLYKLVSILGEPALNAEWIDDTQPTMTKTGAPVLSTSEALKTVKSCLNAYNGNSTKIWLIRDELTKFREADPTTFKQYAAAMKVLREAVTLATLTFVRQSGKDLVDTESLRAHLDAQKLPNNLVRGLSGSQIDEAGQVYTKEGKQLVRPPNGAVKLNPFYYKKNDDSVYVCTEVDGGGRISTVNKKMAAKGGKFSAVQDFLKDEDAFRAKWVLDLKKDGTRDQILACMTELMWATSSRIGEPGNATAGKDTFGLSTLQLQHVHVSPAQIELKFPGKKAYNKAGDLVNEQHFIYKIGKDTTSKKVHQIVTALLAGKTRTGTVFTFNGRPILRQYVGPYLKGHGIGLTAHGFRHINGTRIAQQCLATSTFKKGQCTQAQVDAWVKKELEKVGVALHHRSGTKVTAMVAIKSYIDPGLLVTFYTGLGLRVPKWVPAKSAA